MAIVKPSEYPDWTVNVDGTDNDVVDPTSGQNNVVVPPAGKQLLGWDFKEKPPRNWFNWLARRTTQWIRWLDQEMAVLRASASSTTFNVVSGGGGSVVADGSKWMQLHKLPGTVKTVVCHCHFLFRPDAADNLYYVYAEIPDAFRPSVAAWAPGNLRVCSAVCVKTDGGVKTDIENIYAGVLRDGSTNKLVFSDKQMIFAEPTSGVFSGSGLIAGDGFFVFANLIWQAAT